MSSFGSLVESLTYSAGFATAWLVLAASLFTSWANFGASLASFYAAAWTWLSFLAWTTTLSKSLLAVSAFLFEACAASAWFSAH